MQPKLESETPKLDGSLQTRVLLIGAPKERTMILTKLLIQNPKLSDHLEALQALGTEAQKHRPAKGTNYFWIGISTL